ncbi:hypothetical protein [Mesorhizobium sp. J428]|uniref:hypothetical protein n=1 Tax=Mesorhizobium sp. J428 TaxID=2898440 RepID=UPI002151F263|nr:hypothetical protein [Mesorhizobium sp. J428]MCR5856897.1 hypothetical protein [Mesorhizobium sp. J428]
MANEVLAQEAEIDEQWYEDAIELRGVHLNLLQIKSAFREYEALVRAEGDRIISKLVKPSDMNDEEFVSKK